MAAVPGVKSEVIRIDVLVNCVELCSQAVGPVGSKPWRLDYFQTADKLGIKWKGERLAVLTPPLRSFFDHQPHTLSRLEAATRAYHMPESFIVRFWLRKSV